MIITSNRFRLPSYQSRSSAGGRPSMNARGCYVNQHRINKSCASSAIGRCQNTEFCRSGGRSSSTRIKVKVIEFYCLKSECSPTLWIQIHTYRMVVTPKF